MKKEYIIDYMNFHRWHMFILVVMCFGIILSLSLKFVTLLVFVIWLYRVFVKKDNKQYIVKEYTTKRVKKKEFYDRDNQIASTVNLGGKEK